MSATEGQRKSPQDPPKGLLDEIIKASHGRVKIVDMRPKPQPAAEPERSKAPQR